MKKLVLLLAALLPGLLAHSQEADDRGAYAEVTFVARAEYSSLESGHHLGNSSFYALVDGGFTPNLSFSVSTHLLSSTPADLYRNTLYSCSTNWLDWAYLCYDFGKFRISLGKDYISAGTWETDAYDFDSYYEISSGYWNCLQVYQWGGKFTWAPSEDFNLSAHITTSPFGERPFSSGLYSYTLHAYGKTGCYEGRMAFNFHQLEPKSYMKLFSMGHSLNFEKWQVVWDSYMDFFTKTVPMSQLLYATFSPTEKWAFTGRVAFQTVGQEDEGFLIRRDPYWLGGVVVNWMPIEMLRFHALASYDSMLKSPLFNFGVTWKLTL